MLFRPTGGHDSRQLPPWLTFDVRQNQTMKTSTVFWAAYDTAVIVCSFILGLSAFVFVMSLPRKSGTHELIHAQISEHPALAFVAVPLSILFLVAPFYAARWTYRGVLKTGYSFERRIRRRNEN